MSRHKFSPGHKVRHVELVVICSEEGEGRLNKLTVNRAFHARQDAEMEGLNFAKKMD
jgi:hypothetical protein